MHIKLKGKCLPKVSMKPKAKPIVKFPNVDKKVWKK
jgi:hypothetical protein